MTPVEFYQVLDGFYARKSNFEEIVATAVASIINGCGHQKHPLNAQMLLGRPLRRDWAAAEKKRKEAEATGTSADMTTAERLAQKDAERRARLKKE